MSDIVIPLLIGVILVVGAAMIMSVPLLIAAILVVGVALIIRSID